MPALLARQLGASRSFAVKRDDCLILRGQLARSCYLQIVVPSQRHLRHPLNQKVYAIGTGSDKVQIVDEKTNTVEPTTIPASGAPANSTIDLAHRLLYVGNAGETYQNNPPPPSVSVIKLQ
jgi:YVTN family beta-propeller protein